MKTQKRGPYVRIMEAAKKGKGVVLSPDEVARMSMDSGISEVAYQETLARKGVVTPTPKWLIG